MEAVLHIFFQVRRRKRLEESSSRLQVQKEKKGKGKQVTKVGNSKVVLGPSLEANLPKSKGEEQPQVPRNQPQTAHDACHHYVLGFASKVLKLDIRQMQLTYLYDKSPSRYCFRSHSPQLMMYTYTHITVLLSNYIGPTNHIFLHTPLILLPMLK